MSPTGTNLLSALLNRQSSPQSKRPFPALRMAGRVLALAVLSAAASSQAQDYTFTTFAGVSGTTGSTNGTGSAIGKPLFNNPVGLVVDGNKNVFVTDTANNSIRKITPAGVVTTFAGTSGVAGSSDGTGGAARFNAPQGAVIDSSGNIFVADFSSHTIRKITKDGVVTTLAGSPGASGSVDGTGTAARFTHPTAVAVDGSGNVYVADTDNNQIRKVTSAGVVTTLAGSSTRAFGSVDGTGSAATFRAPQGIVVDSTGTNVYVADTGNNAIRLIVASTGATSTIAGTANTSGFTDAPGTAARFNFPDSLAIDSSGNLYVTDGANSTIRKITPAPSYTVSTLAGSHGQLGFADGTGTSATFNHPSGISVDSDNNVYVADYSNHLIRKISSAGVVTTLAGVPGTAGSVDGTGAATTAASLFFGPSATATDSAGNVYVADTNNQVIRVITPAGVASNLAGNVGFVGSANATGVNASFYNPSGLCIGLNGTIHVADTGNQLVRTVTTPGGVVTGLAGKAGYAGESMTMTTTYTVTTAAPTTQIQTIVTAITTRNPTVVTTTTAVNPTTITAGSPLPANTVENFTLFNLPSSVAADGSGNVFVADYNNNTIRKIDSGGTVTVFAGSGNAGSADGVGTLASFNHPRGLAIDGANLYVTDLGNQLIRKISLTTATVSTVAGGVGATGTADGTGTAARFNGPSGIAVDSSGVLYVADTSNHTIRAISTAGVVTTIAGLGGNPGNADGIGNTVRFNQPTGISVYNGILYVADYRNNTIRKGTLTGTTPVTTPTVPGTTPTGNGKISRPSGIAVDASGTLYVADTANNSIKKIAGDGSVTVFAGRDGTAGSADGTGTAATFNGPTALVADTAGNIYVSDTKNALIRKITSAGVVTTLAGSPSGRGNQDGIGSAATFQSPAGITLDGALNLYVADSYTHTIRKINTVAIAATAAVAATATTPAIPAKAAVPANTVSTLAGNPGSPGDADGVGSSARFNNPTGISVDGTGYLYVADTHNNTIRLLNTADIAATYAADGVTVISAAIPAATVRTIAGSAGISGSYDGIGNFALFSGPTGIFASNSVLYIADTGNNLIRILNGNRVNTVAGIAGIAGYRDGVSSFALLDHPEAVAISGSLFVADTGNNSIRIISGNSIFGINLKDPTPTTTPTTPTTPSTGASGGGSMSSWFAGSLVFLFLLAGRTRRRLA